MATKNTSYNVRPDKHSTSDISSLNPEDGVIVFDETTKKNKYHNSTEWVEFPSDSTLNGRIVVTQENVATTLGGTIDSTKEYFIDGVVDLGTTQITVPTTGITLRGYSFDLSALTSSEDNYTMFISESEAIGSGNILGFDHYISVTGTNSKVYEIYDATGFNAFEFSRVNYIDCTSLGDIHNYRQGLEFGTGRFGGSPSLTLHGTWVGGYRITTSIVRSMSDTTTEPLFKAGTSFVMNSRFLTDINCDLGTLQPFSDFTTSNFANPSTLQVQNAIFSRDGVINADDTNIFTNIDKSDLIADWTGNNGLGNTFEGGRLNVSSELTTTISTLGTWVDVNATWNESVLEHFDSPSSGQLRHLGSNPREYKCTVNFVIESQANNDIGIRLRKYDDSASTFVEFDERRRQVNSLVGGRDVAIFNFSFNVNLDQNDYVYFQVRNNSGTSNVTLELNSDWLLEQR